MTRFVSLACDEKATYAALLPVCAKLWELQGYTPLLQHSLRESNPFEKEILAWTPGRKKYIEERAPLSRANTMRATRLFGWVQADHPQDFILTADVDMFPLSRTFFQDLPPHVMLRACWYMWLGRGGTPPRLTADRLLPTNNSPPYNMHFAMCYAGATRTIWEGLFPAGDWPVLGGNSSSWDEEALTARVLTRVLGKDFWKFNKHGGWCKGDLFLLDPLEAPCLSMYKDMPRGLMGPEDRGIAEKFPSDAIDMIPPRFTANEQPWWIFPVVKHYYPELAAWVDAYVVMLNAVLRGATW